MRLDIFERDGRLGRIYFDEGSDIAMEQGQWEVRQGACNAQVVERSYRMSLFEMREMTDLDKALSAVSAGPSGQLALGEEAVATNPIKSDIAGNLRGGWSLKSQKEESCE